VIAAQPLAVPLAVPMGLPSDLPSPLPDISPDCQQGSLCEVVYRTTGSGWLAGSADWLIAKPVTILCIVGVAMLIRYLLHRMINRAVRTGGSDRSPALLRPLRERAGLGAGKALTERRRQRAETIGSVLRSIVSAVVLAIAFMLVLGEVGINLAPLLASAGIAGIAFGFGAQTLVRDFLSGMFMILEDQYGVGDIVDLGQASGVVESVGLRCTTVRDVGGVLWYVRNGEVLRVGNKTQGWAMVVVDVPLPLGTPLERAEDTLGDVATELGHDEEWKDALLEPPEVLGVEQIAATGLTVRVAVRTTTADQWRVARELRRRISEGLDRAGIHNGSASATAAPPANRPDVVRRGHLDDR
jgi:small conductance mechanosensitive channel